MNRRKALSQATGAAFAVLAAARGASADSDLTMADLDIGGKPVASSVADLSAEEAAPIQLVTLEAGKPKPKKDTPAARLKELTSRRDLTDKEKKELRRLKADEMCEMLGKGC